MESERDEIQAEDVEEFMELGGGSLNYKRTASPPTRIESQAPVTSLPRMDLFNFEAPEFEDSKYVLTSPRSLEACSRLCVKPVDLLYKPLAEFQEELLPQDVPLRTIYNIYDEKERNREKKLGLCREERQRIIEEQNEKPQQRVKIVSKSVLPSRGLVTLSKKSTLRERKHLSHSDEELDKGSLQRKRTAWTTSVGHKRITHDEINERVKELHEESTKLRQDLLSRKEERVKLRQKKGKSRLRSNSTGSLTLAGTSLLNKTNVTKAMPITSVKLKTALKNSTDVKNIPVTPRDQKILELMIEKRQLEKLQQQARQERELAWEEQKKHEEKLRIEAEMRRRKLIAEENRIKDMKKQEKEKERRKEEKQLFQNHAKAIENRMKKWSSLSEIQRHVSEKNHRMQEEEEEEMRALIKQKTEQDLQTAAQRKQAQLLEEAMKKMMLNRTERRKFEDRYKVLEDDYNTALEEVQNSMNVRLSQAKSKHEQVLKRREQELLLSKLEREKRALHAKLSQEKLNAEMEAWKDTIIQHRQMVDKQVKNSVSRSTVMKARKAHEDRIQKEKKLKTNIKKIQEEVEEWQRYTENNLGKKEKKTNLIQKEKDLTIEKSRHMAYATQRLRDEIRERYGHESFDQKAFRAVLHNRIGMGIAASTKNVSTVRI
ncbi:hypothetical protein CHS0354_026230 [Potamilus streckersoni]|uniref:Coiled-coil domain-containing protein 177 n=1 Tax=Potamilus streckersoni TaxID=2493646 RepID=A0AAE0TG62_9BIVA|nr:hypothetical protein CHS0354_026230 [Potamilus streckersoni]